MTSYLVCAILLVSCARTASEEAGPILPKAPDYAENEMWYQCNQNDSAEIDVFYIISTCSFDWKDSLSRTVHFMNIYDSAQRAYMDHYLYEGYLLFSPTCRFYAPYYRQITLESWDTTRKAIDRQYSYSHKDVAAAFRYYMAHLNKGRRFILAGHSQGGKAVIELLKHDITDEEYQRFIAGYVFGYAISQKELEEYPKLRPATGRYDNGVICFNSLSTPIATTQICADNVVCINPINWSTDTAYASSAENLGSVFLRQDNTLDTLHCVGARIDATTHTLVIDGLNDDDYFIPSVGHYFPKGNYHLYEQKLFYLNIQQNVKDRAGLK